jgi:hypothetical protein
VDAAVLASAIGSSVAVLTAVAAMFASIYKRGLNEGRVTEILSRLTTEAADHEARLRALESARTLTGASSLVSPPRRC